MLPSSPRTAGHLCHSQATHRSRGWFGQLVAHHFLSSVRTHGGFFMLCNSFCSPVALVDFHCSRPTLVTAFLVVFSARFSAVSEWRRRARVPEVRVFGGSVSQYCWCQHVCQQFRYPSVDVTRGSSQLQNLPVCAMISWKCGLLATRVGKGARVSCLRRRRGPWEPTFCRRFEVVAESPLIPTGTSSSFPMVTSVFPRVISVFVRIRHETFVGIGLLPCFLPSSVEQSETGDRPSV